MGLFPIFVEQEFRSLWSTNNSMKGSTIQNRMKKSYPELFEAIGDADLDDLFEKNRTYRRNSAIQKLADFLKENPKISLALNLALMQKDPNSSQLAQENESLTQEGVNDPSGENGEIIQEENND